MLTRSGQVKSTKTVVFHIYPMGYIFAFITGYLMAMNLARKSVVKKVPHECMDQSKVHEKTIPDHMKSAKDYHEWLTKQMNEEKILLERRRRFYES